MKILMTLAGALALAGAAFAGTVSGFVTQAENGEPLQYVNVVVSGTRIGTQTNKKGYYVLTVNRAGPAEIDFSTVAYQRNVQLVEFKSAADNISLDVQMTKSAIELSRVVVTAKAQKENDGPLIRSSTISQSGADLSKILSPVEADVFRAVLALPGVAPISDFSSGLYVRGGSPDQNLILLDDIDVYNPSHFGGIFSTFNTDAVENIELIKGGYPAKYGGRLSSVLDVTNRQGNRMDFSGAARLSLISSSLTMEGPWKLGGTGGSYMASVRRTYLELVKTVYEELPDYYFYDGHASFNWDIDQRNKLSFSGYFGKDALTFDLGAVLDLDWGNNTFTTQWVHIFNPRLFSQFVLAGSEFMSNFDQLSADGDKILERHNGIRDLTAKGILSWKPNNAHEVESGFEVKWNDTWLNQATTYMIDQNSLADIDVKSLTSSVFVQDNWAINELWTLQPGVRASWYRSLGVEPSHIPPASFFNVEPRLSLRRNLDVGESIYANFGAYHQYLTLMTMDVSTPFDIWFPLDGSLDPGRSLHYILGYKRDLSDYFSWDSEIYYKTYDNLLQYNDAANFAWDNQSGTLADAFHVGTGYTYGADLLLRNDWNGLQGFVGYTLSQTKRKINGVNVDPETGEAEPFFPRYDQSHALTVIQTYNVSQNTGFQILGADIKLGMNFSYTSGQPSQVPERIYFDGEEFQLIYSYEDRERLPAYMRLDLSTRYEWITRWGTIEPYLEFINVFNRKNVSFRSYSLLPQDDGTLELLSRDGAQFPFLPFLGINITW